MNAWHITFVGSLINFGLALWEAQTSSGSKAPWFMAMTGWFVAALGSVTLAFGGK